MIFDNRDGAPRPNEPGEIAQSDLGGGPVPQQVGSHDANQLSDEMTKYLRFMLTPNPPNLGS
jgi:hypothetical protein